MLNTSRLIASPKFTLPATPSTEKYILDTHDHPVIDPVWTLYERAMNRSGPTATLLEWDDRIPSFEEVHREALKANRFIESLDAKKAAA